MARKPNYRFDRLQKDRAKAAKKAERLEAKRNRSAKAGQPAEDEGQPVEDEGQPVEDGGDRREDGES
ncbi:MAG: hypothetical protein JNM75_11430 [Rhodospirillales bacterium]|nr:hypothetical protein [Rhodospirillales bacterium]